MFRLRHVAVTLGALPGSILIDDRSSDRTLGALPGTILIDDRASGFGLV